MKEGPTVSRIAALIGDPARANILVELMDGRALTVTELSRVAGVSIQTASGHLAKLNEAALTVVEKQGRHRYIRLSGPDVAEALEMLMVVAQRTGAVRVRTGPRDTALRTARQCYDHLAGEWAVELFDKLVNHGLIGVDPALRVTTAGVTFFANFGIDLATLEGNSRPLCRACLDWSERRHHLGGALGATLLKTFVERGWAIRKTGRIIALSETHMRTFLSSIEEQS
jgi:DNA-binding transcriptional ArsR family regulator